MESHLSTANTRQQMAATASLGYWDQTCDWSTIRDCKQRDMSTTSASNGSIVSSAEPRSLPAMASGPGSMGYLMPNRLPTQSTRSFGPKTATTQDQTSSRDRSWTFVASSSSQWHSPVESMTTSSSPHDLADDMPYLSSSVSLFPQDDSAGFDNAMATSVPWTRTWDWNWNCNVVPSGQTLFGEVVFPVQPVSGAAGQNGSMAFLPFDMPRTESDGQVSKHAEAWSVAHPSASVTAPAATVATPATALTTLPSGSRKRQASSEPSSSRSRLLAPKLAESTTEKRPFEPHYTHIWTEDGVSKRVGAIAKTSYVRPTHPRRMCHKCDEHPDGFRGEHELRRHVDRAHKTVRKMWVCVNASDNPKFLSGCKHCRNGKRYGAYYNAAAHLRRQHFNPRPTRARGRNAVKTEERRGGKGGGDNPPMDVLKHYMKEIDEVILDESDGDGDGDSEDDGTTKGSAVEARPGGPASATTPAPADTTAMAPLTSANEPSNLLSDQDLFDIESAAFDF